MGNKYAKQAAVWYFFAGTHQNIFVLVWKEEMIEQGKQGVIQIWFFESFRTKAIILASPHWIARVPRNPERK